LSANAERADETLEDIELRQTIPKPCFEKPINGGKHVIEKYVNNNKNNQLA
jgi:hypothetical protein